MRITSGTNRRLRLFAVTQIAASFVLLAGAGMLLTTLMALQRRPQGFNTRNVLAMNVPVDVVRAHAGAESPASTRRSSGASASCPASRRVAVGTAVPWRDAGAFGSGSQFTVEGYAKADGEEDPRARFRTVSPGFFASLGVPIIAGRDFNDGDRRDAEKVVIVSQSVAQRMFPNQDAVNRQLDVDRSGDEVHRRQHRRRGASSASSPTWTTRTSIPGPAMTRVSPARAGDRRRPAVRARARRIPMRSCRRSRGSSASCRRSSRSSRRRRSRTCAPKCSRRTG